MEAPDAASRPEGRLTYILGNALLFVIFSGPCKRQDFET
jgi:hypothetical protein